MFVMIDKSKHMSVTHTEIEIIYIKATGFREVTQMHPYTLSASK